MKKIIAFAMLALLVLIMAACDPISLMKQISEEAAQRQQESADADVSTGHEALLDTDGTKAWPSDKLPDTVPPIPGISILDVMCDDESVAIMFEGCDQATADAYVSQLESMGWELWSEDIDDGYYYHDFENPENELLSFIWSSNDDIGSILWLHDDGGTDEDEIDTDQYDLWPSDKLPDNVPEIPGVLVSNVLLDDNSVIIFFEGCDQDIVDAYVAQLKSIGWYGGDAVTVDGTYIVDFSDSDATLMFSWNVEDGTGDLIYMKG